MQQVTPLGIYICTTFKCHVNKFQQTADDNIVMKVQIKTENNYANTKV